MKRGPANRDRITHALQSVRHRLTQRLEANATIQTLCVTIQTGNSRVSRYFNNHGASTSRNPVRAPTVKRLATVYSVAMCSWFP